MIGANYDLENQRAIQSSEYVTDPSKVNTLAGGTQFGSIRRQA